MYTDITLEFGGFYNWHEEYIYDRINAYEIDPEKVDYKKTFDNYAEAWLYRLENAIHADKDYRDTTVGFDVHLNYKGLASPRYYNYNTDRIEAQIETLSAKKLVNKFKDDEKFREFARPQYTSRDGYYSRYDSLEDVIESADAHGPYVMAFAHLTETILEYIAEELEINQDIYDLEYDIEYIRSNSNV